MSQLRRQMSELNMGGGGGGTPIKRALSSTIGGSTPSGAPPRTPTSMRKSTFGGATPARALFPEQAKTAAAAAGGSNVSIAARVRPLNADKEVHNGVTVRDNAICFQSSSRTAQNGASTPRAQPQNVFLYDQVFGETASQADVFALAEERVLASFVEGYHGTIFTYGQTGSGKTWSMFGSDSDPGLIPRATEYIFRNQPEGFQCRVTLSCLEIYCEEVFDLFGATTTTTTANAIVTSRAKLDIRERVLPNHDREIFVEGLTEEPVADAQAALALVRRGFVGRHVSATRMNRESSRSHTVVALTLTAEKDEGRRKVVRTSKLHMIDLAGSERMNAVQTEGDAFVETKKINMSLTTLAKVIEELASNAPRVSFRESKLTYLLSRSLQDAKILLIAAVSPALAHTSESESTLKFANNMKRVRSGARVHESVEEDPAVLRQQIRNLHVEIGALQTMLANGSTPSGSGVGAHSASASGAALSAAAAAAVEPKSLLGAQDLHELCSEMRGWHTALIDQMETQIATDRSLLHARAFVRYRNRRFRDLVASLSPIDDADRNRALSRASVLTTAAASSASASPQFLIPDEFCAESAALTSPTALARVSAAAGAASAAGSVVDEESPKMRRLRKIRALLDSHLHEIDTTGTPDRWTRTGDDEDDENDTLCDAAGAQPHATAVASSNSDCGAPSLVQRTDRSNDCALRQCGKLHGVLLQFYRQFPTAFDRIQHGVDPLEAVAQAAQAREQAALAHAREQAARRECDALREERAAALVEVQRAREAAEAERAAIARMRETADQERAMFKLERLALEREVAAARAELAQSKCVPLSASSKPAAGVAAAGTGSAHQWAAPRSVHCGSSTPRRVVTAAAAAPSSSSAIGGNGSSARDTPSSRFSTELMAAATTHCALSPLSGSGCSNVASLSNSLVDSMVMLGGMEDEDDDERNADDDAETDDEADEQQTPLGGDEAEISFPNLGKARRVAAAKKQPLSAADAQTESNVVHFHRSASNSNILAAADADATGSKMPVRDAISTAASGSGSANKKSSAKHAPAAAEATVVIGSSRAALQRAKSSQPQSQFQFNTAQIASAAPPAKTAASERPRRQTQQMRESVGSFSLQPGAVVVVSDPSPGNSPHGSSAAAAASSNANSVRANGNLGVASNVNVSVSTMNARRKSTRNTRQVVIESVDQEMGDESLAETSFLKRFQVDAPGMAPIPAKPIAAADAVKPSTVRATSLKLGVPPSPKVAAARGSLLALALAATAGVENAGGSHGNMQSAAEPKQQLQQRKVSVEAPLAQVPLAGFFVSI